MENTTSVIEERLKKKDYYMEINKKNEWYFMPVTAGVPSSSIDAEVDFNTRDYNLNFTLPREAKQNVKDQALENKIPIVSFKILDLSKKDHENFIDKFFFKLDNHIKTKEMQHRLGDSPKSFTKYLVVEDFNTTGLTGIFDNWSKMENEEDNFYHFMWTIGESRKEGEKGGRRGLGRNVFCITSYFRSFFALTKRYDDKKKFLMGFSNLGSHKDNSGKKCHNIGHFGTFYKGDKKKEFLQPIDDEDYIQTFSNIFKLERGDKPGLSVVCPSVDIPDLPIDQKVIEENVLASGFLPILLNRIIVKVGEKTFDKDSTSKYLKPDDLDFWNFVKDAKKEENAFKINFVYSGKRGQAINEDSFSKDEFKKIKKLYDENKILVFKVPVNFFNKKSNKKISTFYKVYIKKRKKSALIGKCIMLRNVMSLVESADRHDVENNYIFIDFEEKGISEFVGDGEIANHTQLSPTHNMLKINYKDYFNIANFINNTPKYFLQTLGDADDDEIDYKSLSQFAELSMSELKEEKDDEDDNEGDTGGIIEVKERTQSAFTIEKITKGATIKGLDAMSYINKEEFPVDIKIKCAYAVLRGNPFSYYNSNTDREINMNNLKINFSKGVNIKEKKDNELEISVKDKDFLVSITGPGNDLAWDVDFCDERLYDQIPKIKINEDN